MDKPVFSQDAPGRFGDLLQGVSDKGDRYVVEHSPVGHARTGAAERVRGGNGRPLGEQDGKLLPDRLQQAYWDGGHGILRR